MATEINKRQIDDGFDGAIKLALMILGMSLYFAWFFALLTTTYNPNGTGFFTITGSLDSVIMLFGLLVSLFLIKTLLSEAKFRSALSFFVVGALSSGILYFIANCGFIEILPFVLRGALWLSVGLTSGFLYVLWSPVWKKEISYERAIVFVAVCLIIGAALASLITIVPYVSILLRAFLPIGSVVCFQVFISKNSLDSVEANENKRIKNFSGKLDFATLSYSIFMGLGLFALRVESLWPYNIFVIALAIIISCVLALVDSSQKRRLSETFCNKHLNFYQILPALPLLFAVLYPESAAVSYLFSAFLYLLLFTLFLVAQRADIIIALNVFDSSPVMSYARAGLPSVGGIFIGFFAAYLVEGFLWGRVDPASLAIALFVILVLFSAMYTYVITGIYLAVDGAGGKYEEQAVRTAASINNWRISCEIFADLHKLSDREKEVLVYLSRGRNAHYIAQTLFISESTAKSHTYNIYKKAALHSNQDLIGSIEKISRQNPIHLGNPTEGALSEN